MSPLIFGVEVAGSAYEQFLGKQISLTAGQAKIEETDEKTGGVYYRRNAIVDSSKNTVEVVSKTPKEVSPIRADPACSSDGFPAGRLSDFTGQHKDYYTNSGADWASTTIAKEEK